MVKLDMLISLNYYKVMELPMGVISIPKLGLICHMAYLIHGAVERELLVMEQVVSIIGHQTIRLESEECRN